MESAVRLWHLGIFFLVCKYTFIESQDSTSHYTIIEKQRYDGWYNNLGHPSWGSIYSHLTRKVPPSYADGVYMLAGQNRPSARVISDAIMSGSDGLASSKNKTVLMAFFGQLVSSEILMASETGCPLELHKIEIAKCDHMYDEECQGDRYMPFLRAEYDSRTGQSPNSPREQINSMTSWIDGSFVYSTSEAWVNAMRSFENGKFRIDEDHLERNHPPRNKLRVPLVNAPTPHLHRSRSPEKILMLGDPRINQNPAILALGIVFFRYHNFIAEKMQREHSDWSDEDLFQKTRRWVIASLQRIIVYEYLPALLDEKMEPYTGYKPDVHPGISHVFQSAAFRFGHTMIPPGLFMRDGNCNIKKTSTGRDAIRLCSTWWDRLFGPMEFSRRDLGALNIMRGRDNGLPDYNTVRRTFGLPTITNWTDINPHAFRKNPEVFYRLKELYKDTNNIDVYIGGMLESNNGPGPLFKKIIKEQFLRIRDADRFWFENKENEWKLKLFSILFTEEEIHQVQQIRLYDILLSVTNISAGQIQENLFVWHDGDPCPQPFQINSTILESCPYVKGFDYFRGNEVVYIYTCLFIAFIPIICAGVGYGVVKLQNRRRRRIKLKQEENNNTKTVDKMRVKEWLHQNHKRYGTVKFGPDQALYTVNRKGEKLRKVDFTSVETIVCEVTTDHLHKPAVLVRVPKDHDLVLEFYSVQSRKKFLYKLETFVANHRKTLEQIPSPREQMIANAETKERRQKRLEHFFREAYALTFGLKPGEKRKFEDVTTDVIMVMRTSLSKKEFAEALGMKSGSVFVKQMFNCVDKDGDGRISFQEFLDTVVLFSKGKTEDKLRIIFDMCDYDGNGVIDKKELSNIIRSLVDIAKTNSLTEQQETGLIDGMFSSAGLEHKDVLTYDDFKLMMREYKGDFVAIGLDCKGAKQNFLDTSTNVARMTSFYIDTKLETRRNWFKLKWDELSTYLEEYRQHIFYLFIFYVITFALFIERFIRLTRVLFVDYTYMSEHTDLRHIMGMGIAITRGSAAALSFCYSLLLLTMARNLITKLRELSIHQYIPLDSHVQFHKIVACTALVCTITHVIGHIVNFYHVSTQPLEHLKCLTKEMHFPSDYRPTLAYWLFQSLTDTKVLDIFPWTSNNVIKVKFYRPPNFKYLSGQWIRLSCTAFKTQEYHSFTLTSAPHENYLSTHIKAQGPWTWKLRNYFDPLNLPEHQMLPKIRLEGPYGGGNQDWYKFEVAIMVGGGIGVTPYASILNDLVFGTSTNRYSGVACKKVYFLWVCPSHRHFEWFIDVLRDVEKKDYICENHFQRISNRSMFTGLKAVNHFGRPDMSSFFKFVQKQHSYVSKVGVFSCGPGALTKSVNQACDQIRSIGIETWTTHFGHHLRKLGQAITVAQEIKDSYKSATLEELDGNELVKQTALDIEKFLLLKIEAVKRISDTAENAAKDYQYDPTIEPFITIDDEKHLRYPNAKFLNQTMWLLEENERFKERVSLDFSTIHVETNVDDKSTRVLNGIEATKVLDPVFIDNYKHDPTLYWQYFGSAKGYLRNYPGVEWPTPYSSEAEDEHPADIYDCCMRPWFIEAATSPKDVVILLDISGSMHGLRYAIATYVVDNILDSLTQNDFVGVFKFSSDIENVVPCFNRTLVPAYESVAGIEMKNETNFTMALSFVFELLQDVIEEMLAIYNFSGRASQCNQAIMIVADGASEKNEDVFLKYDPDHRIRVFTYLIGREVTEYEDMMWMACHQRGYFGHIFGLSQVPDQVEKHIPVMARPLAFERVHPIIWTPLYADITVRTSSTKNKRERYEQEDMDKCELMTTVAMPAYNQSMVEVAVTEDNITTIEKIQKDELLGVAGVDVPIKEIRKLIPIYKYKQLINAFHLMADIETMPIYTKLLKIGYSNMDIIDVEFGFADEDPWQRDPDILELRSQMIQRRTDSLTATVKISYDHQKRIIVRENSYFFTPIEMTPFTLGIALPYGKVRIKPNNIDNILNLNGTH
uniref:NAD(P)H oxidase (H2O2-forming) n=1 Tax=Strigamia maritima TaxID=126957 RepID=T1IYT7_STRMM